jgi:hypothetical protein
LNSLPSEKAHQPAITHRPVSRSWTDAPAPRINVIEREK